MSANSRPDPDPVPGINAGPAQGTFTIWLVRHAEVELPASLCGQACCYGATDLSASPAATQAAARALSTQLQHLGQNGAPRRVSGLRRAQQLAHALDAALPGSRQAWQTDLRLNEFDFGRWELTPWADIPKAAFDAWTNDFAHHPFGGAETVQGMVSRVRAALVHSAQQLEASGHAEAVWVAHAGTARALQVLQASPVGQVQTAAEWPLHAPAPGALCAYAFPLEAFIH